MPKVESSLQNSQNKSVWKQSFNLGEHEFENGNYEKALIYFGEAKKIAQPAPGSEQLGLTLQQLGKTFDKQQNTADAQANFVQALTEFKKLSGVKAALFIGTLKLDWASVSLGVNNQESFLLLSEAYRIGGSVKNDEAFQKLEARAAYKIGASYQWLGSNVRGLVWLEKAQQLLSRIKFTDPNNQDKEEFDIAIYTHLAALSAGDYGLALKQLNKAEEIIKGISTSSHKIRLLKAKAALYDTFGDYAEAETAIHQALDLLAKNGDTYQQSEFLVQSLYLNLWQEKYESAEKDLGQIKALPEFKNNPEIEFFLSTANGLLSAVKGDLSASEQSFQKAEDLSQQAGNNPVFFTRLNTLKMAAYYKTGQYSRADEMIQKLLDFAAASSDKEPLYRIYATRARIKYLDKDLKQAEEYARRAIPLVEMGRAATQTPQLSLNFFKEYNDPYGVLLDIRLAEKNNVDAFNLADRVKSRWLSDRLESNSYWKTERNYSPAIKEKIFTLSLDELSQKDFTPAQESELKKLEQDFLSTDAQPVITNVASRTDEINNLFEQLESSNILSDTAVLSYCFNGQNSLTAFLWQRGQALQTVNLAVNEKEAELLASETSQKIKDQIYYKRDAKELYDKLMAPLSIKAKHLVIVPDKSLWKLPFQAFSANGSKYLIEEKIISYAPSIAIFLNQLRHPQPDRKTLQVFANTSIKDHYLRYVDQEARDIALLYNVKPNLNATVKQFNQSNDQSDIIHFSMHSEINRVEPLKSFLAFEPSGASNGQVTVDDLLKIKLKKGSLAFLASCETNNVLTGEGLISLAWGLMAGGATTVVSAQWEIKDRSTNVFTRKFYENYKTGLSAAEAIQKTSIEMINKKSATENYTEPYNWAAFTLSGDYR